VVLPPFDRQKLKLRNALDLDDERQAAAARSAGQGMMEVAELADVIRSLELAATAGAPVASDLAEKATLYARPLAAARRA
jgi:hypothetical protein